MRQAVEQLARDVRRLVLVAAHVHDLRHQVARMAGAHVEPARLVVPPLQILDDHRVEVTFCRLQLSAKIFVNSSVVGFFA